MVKRKEEEAEGTTAIPEPEVTPEAEKTYSKAEYEAEMTRLQEEHQANLEGALKEQFNKLNERLSRKGAELEQLRRKPGTSQYPQSQVNKAFLGALESGDYGEAKAMLSQMEIAEVEAGKRQQWEEAGEEMRGKFKQIIVDAGQDPDNDEFVDIMLDVESAIYGHGKFPLIEKKLNKKLKTVPVKETPKEKGKVTLADLSDEDKEELKRQAMESELGTHITSPSGASGNWEEARDAFIKNPSNPQVFARYDEMRKQRETK